MTYMIGISSKLSDISAMFLEIWSTRSMAKQIVRQIIKRRPGKPGKESRKRSRGE